MIIPPIHNFTFYHMNILNPFHRDQHAVLARSATDFQSLHELFHTTQGLEHPTHLPRSSQSLKRKIVLPFPGTIFIT
jgi:hypothetical protein